MNTPSTEEVRMRYIGATRDEYGDEFSAEFDRWLAEHDRQVRAEERERLEQVFTAQFADCEAGIRADERKKVAAGIEYLEGLTVDNKVGYHCPACGHVMVRGRDESAPAGCDRCDWTLRAGAAVV